MTNKWDYRNTFRGPNAQAAYEETRKLRDVMTYPEAPTTGPLVTVESVAAPTLFGSNNPDYIITDATAKAKVLAKVVRDQKLASNISGREYVRLEGWTTLGAMMGVFPVTQWTRPIERTGGEIGGNGWECRVEARTLSGQLVGAAEAQCARDENTWKNRADYALRSMAQTRATSKALRLPLGFIMALAGFDPTPAEEMDEEPRKPAQATSAPPQRVQKPSTPLTSETAKQLLSAWELCRSWENFTGVIRPTLEEQWPQAFQDGKQRIQVLTEEQAFDVLATLDELMRGPTAE